MFELFLLRSSSISRHNESTLAAERPRYLSHLMKEGRSHKTLENVMFILVSLERHLPLSQTAISHIEIETSAEIWATTVHRLC